MPPAPQTTTRPRIALAIAFAFILPSVVIGGLFVALDDTLAQGQPLRAALAFAPAAVVAGLFMGWPFVLSAVAIWGLLDQFNRHYGWTAALIGLLAGVAVVLVNFRTGAIFDPRIAYSLCPALGVLTGLGVWWIAYGRQGRLPRPIATRTQLSL